MSFSNSTLVKEVPPGYADLACGFQLRLSIVGDQELEVAREVTDDWKRYVSEDVEGFMGTLGPMYAGGTAIALPEVPPDRFAAVAYCVEMFFLIDDVLDGKYELKGAEQGASFHSLRNRMHQQGLDQIYGKLYAKLAKIDRASAAKTMKFLSIYEDNWHGAVNQVQFGDIVSFLEVRMHDVGQLWFHSLVVFGFGLDLSEDEEDLLARIRKCLWYGVALINDLCSVDKELKETGFSKETNAVFLIMDRDKVDLNDAKDVVRDLTRQYMAQYRQDLAHIRATHPPFSHGLEKAIEANELTYSGSVAWSLQCYRYQGYPGAICGPYSPMTQESSSAVVMGHRNGQMVPSAYAGNDSTNIAGRDTTSENSPVDSLCARDRARMTQLTDSLSTGDLESTLSNISCSIEATSGSLIAQPYEYTKSLPSGGIRKKLISALNTWFQIPDVHVDAVQDIIEILHTASLMLDDIEDESSLRRGRPPAHAIFGFAQTINSSNFQLIRALKEGNTRLTGSDWLSIFTEELETLFQGQASDLYWAHNLQCASIEQYYHMVDGKTGGMIRLLVRLLQSQIPIREEISPPDLSRFATLFGRYYQVYDDYRNMSSPSYAETKGVGTDIEEGHFSLPLILAIQTDTTGIIRNVLSQRYRNGAILSEQTKRLILRRVKDCGALDTCRKHLVTLKNLLFGELKELERIHKVENFAMRLIIDMIEIN